MYTKKVYGNTDMRIQRKYTVDTYVEYIMVVLDV